MFVHRCKFPDKATFQAWQKPDDVVTVVEIGLIEATPAQFDENDNIIAEATYLEGYHVDIKSHSLIESLKDYIVVPQNPRHGVLWAEGCHIVTEEDFILKPTDSWLKADIQAYLTANGIEWTTSMTKAQLLELCG
jgi:hypothetical protein